jgi:hypothetical protein
MASVAPDVQPTLEPSAPPCGPFERPIGAFADPSPQALVPPCGQLCLQGLCSSTRAILARPAASPTHASAVVPSSHAALPVLQRPTGSSPAAASSHHSRPPLTPRLDQRAEPRTRARRALPTTPASRSGSALMLENGSVLLLSIKCHFQRILAMFLCILLKSKLDNAPNDLQLIAQTSELYARFDPRGSDEK